MDKMKLCTDFADEVCKILNIKRSLIKFVKPEEMLTATQKSTLIPGIVLIRDDLDEIPDLLFAVAHELRHVHQIAHGERLEGYQTSDKISTESYNLQPVEVDANAFAALVMADTFGISPRFNNLPESVRKAIGTRKKQIVHEFE